MRVESFDTVRVDKGSDSRRATEELLRLKSVCSVLRS